MHKKRLIYHAYREFNVYILVTLGLFEFIDGSEHLIMLKIPSIVTLQEWFNTQFWLFLIIDSDILKIFSNYDGLPYSYPISLRLTCESVKDMIVRECFLPFSLPKLARKCTPTTFHIWREKQTFEKSVHNDNKRKIAL